MSATETIVVRDVEFPVDGEVPRYWLGGRRAVTLFYNNLSTFFPPGERFFVASVKAHREHVKDERLQAEARAFSAQEGVHSREHVRYNRLLRAQGYPTDAMEARVDRLLAWVKRHAPKRRQLAATCALEHFTALLAQMLLGDPRLLDGAHPTMAALWRWHAAEENEHKAVAFDVFRAAGGTWRERVFAMVLATFIFWGKVLEHQVRLMRHDEILWNPREWGSLAWYLLVSPGGMLRLIPRYLAYFRPGFHPNDHDTTALLHGWRRDPGALPAARPARTHGPG